ncbi:MAG: serine--tRNA ligase [Halobacteriovoraceae bacterium]|nr:serine--tRNA ligase [Halobacteriovoraceae bacterium]
MLDIKLIEQETEFVVENLKKRNFDTSVIEQIINYNIKRKSLVTQIDEHRSQVKKLSQEIGQLKRKGEDAQDLTHQVHQIKIDLETDEHALKEVESKQTFLLEGIPNLIDEIVPLGASDSDNQEVHRWGEPRKFDFDVKDHADLGEALGMLDFEAAAKLTGSRFVVYRKDLAKLERALAAFMLDYLGKQGFEEMIPPFIVHERCLHGTGQLPKFKEDVFKLEGHDWYLIPTSEVPLTNLLREQMLPEDNFPFKFTALTPCFRSEAGSYGKDTKGIIRVHQFNKVEMVAITKADQSEDVHQQMVGHAQGMLEALGLPYRSMLLCSGDIGFGARKCFDLEVWLPSQNCYREISSISNCWDFQARRAGIRYKEGSGKPQFAHTLNGSGLAVGRTVVAILENYQQEDGSIEVPEVLVPYMGGKKKIGA